MQSRLFPAESKESHKLNEIKTEILKDFGRYIESLLKVEASHFRVRAQGVLTSIKAATSSLDIYAILEGQRIIFSNSNSNSEPGRLSELNATLFKSPLPLFFVTSSSIPVGINLDEIEKNGYCDLISRSLTRIAPLAKLKEKQEDAEKFTKGFQKMKKNILDLFDKFKESSHKDRASDIRAALDKATEVAEVSAILENQKEIFEGSKLTNFGDILKNVNILYKGYSVNFLNLDLKKDPYYQLILASETVFQNFTSNPLGENQFLRLGNR